MSSNVFLHIRSSELGDNSGPIWSMSDRHRSKIFVTKLLKFYFLAARNLVCFSHSTGDQTKDCDQTRGFKTCFTRYNSGICNRLRIIHEVDSPCNIEKLMASVKRTFGAFLVGHLKNFPKKYVQTSSANFMTCSGQL